MFMKKKMKKSNINVEQKYITMDFLIKNKQNRDIKIVKEPTDPQCMRVSMGGTKKDGFYLTYRADEMNDVELMLKECLEAFKVANTKHKQINN